MAHWQTARFRLALDRPLVMGIVNVTPDSFSDGGRYFEPSTAIAHAERLLAEGADIVDIGGESTRPGATGPDVDEERRRVLPVVAAAVRLGCPVSVDTSSPEVMRAALDLGADIVNDVRALSRPGALEAVAGHPTAGVCLMHMRGEPRDMQRAPDYSDVVVDVARTLREHAGRAVAAGISRDRIVLDPGIGFGKTVEHNLELLRRQAELAELGWPLLVGWSRKSTLGAVTGRPVGERMPASIAAALLAAQRGAAVLRVHDVRATVDALAVWRAAALEPAAPRHA
jgi:dihydropteroate synthase